MSAKVRGKADVDVVGFSLVSKVLKVNAPAREQILFEA